MPLQRYRITKATIALFEEDGRHVTSMVPEGATIVIDSETFDGDKLVHVLWAEKRVMMFTQDLRRRGELLDGRTE
ncbi:MAG TPA: hypothetical protein VLN48_10260 [Bryobacteraceae bacterium]|nr:hypothetical protein [Bryobacteraceae bacterium]